MQHIIANIASQMERGDYETGLIRWLQAERKNEVFDKYIVKFNPNILQELPVLVSLSAGTVISEELDGPFLRERVSWLEVILHGLHASLPDVVSTYQQYKKLSGKSSDLIVWKQDPQVREVLPNIMGRTISRLEALFMRLNNSRAQGDPIINQLSSMMLMANRVSNATTHPLY